MMGRWGRCSGRVGSGCGGEVCKAKPFSGAPEGSAGSRSRSQSAEMPPRTTADGPDGRHNRDASKYTRARFVRRKMCA